MTTKIIFKEFRFLEGYWSDKELTDGLLLEDNQELVSIHYQSNADSFNKDIGYNNYSVLVVIKETV